jgi:hypothetical protein
MNKTLLLLTLPSLTACLEPNPMNKGGGGDEGEATETGSTSDEPSNTTDHDDDADPDDGGSTTSPDPGDGSEGEGEGEGDGETGDGESSESGTVQPEPTCDLETHQCISKVPDGWSGPIAQLDASDPIGCAGDFSEPVLDTFEDVFADAAACTCTCGSPNGGTCAETAVVDFYSEFTFFGTTFNTTECEAITDGDVVLEFGNIHDFPSGYEESDVFIIAEAPAVDTVGSCNVATETSELSDPIVTGEQAACALADPLESCDAETDCVPKVAAPFEAGVCIWAEGDLECPAGSDFSNREVRGAGLLDSRACSDCSCGPASGEDCDDAVVRLWRTGGWVDRSVDGDCNGASLGPGNVWTGVSFDPGDPSGGACAESGGEAEGSVEPEQVFTFCCT